MGYFVSKTIQVELLTKYSFIRVKLPEYSSMFVPYLRRNERRCTILLELIYLIKQRDYTDPSFLNSLRLCSYERHNNRILKIKDIAN